MFKRFQSQADTYQASSGITYMPGHLHDFFTSKIYSLESLLSWDADGKVLGTNGRYNYPTCINKDEQHGKIFSFGGIDFNGFIFPRTWFSALSTPTLADSELLTSISTSVPFGWAKGIMIADKIFNSVPIGGVISGKFYFDIFLTNVIKSIGLSINAITADTYSVALKKTNSSWSVTTIATGSSVDSSIIQLWATNITLSTDEVMYLEVSLTALSLWNKNLPRLSISNSHILF